MKFADDYWQTLSITKHDIEFLQNHLFETETPLGTRELAAVLIGERIRAEREAQEIQLKNSGTVYLPKDQYKQGQKLIFPALAMATGEVTLVRPGSNPQLGVFDVIEVAMDAGGARLFAAALNDHKLNQPVEEVTDPTADLQVVLAEYGEQLEQKLWAALAAEENLAQVAGHWFPRALLVDINPGHLNLAEAVIEMAGGEPLSAANLMEQIDLHGDTNTSLTEFSLNYVLQEDGRFDEVGPIGQVLWCLRRLEPEAVREVPVFLQYKPIQYDRSLLNGQMLALEAQLDDELSDADTKPQRANEATLTLTYPHWRAGTLPISSRVRSFIPTAQYAPRIRFTLVDGKTGEKIPAWVVREHGYVYGLRNWYEKQKLIPGATIVVRPGKAPGEVIVDAKTRRPVRDWVRTVLAGSDGGLVFALLKQEVACEYNDRMVVVVPDLSAVDKSFAHTAKSGQSLERLTRDMMRELSKLTPQGHVHAEELYSAVNILRRVPPGPLFATLAATSGFVHVGDLHFRLGETTQEEG